MTNNFLLGLTHNLMLKNKCIFYIAVFFIPSLIKFIVGIKMNGKILNSRPSSGMVIILNQISIYSAIIIP